MAGTFQESFHLVYQAFETLSNPESRKKYDHQLAARAASAAKSKMSKASAKTQTVAPTPRPAPNSAASGSQGSQVDEKSTAEAKLLRKLHELLKRLPRDLRQEVFERDFSQKQRLLLEKWMVGAPADSVPMLTQCSNRKQDNEAGSWF